MSVIQWAKFFCDAGLQEDIAVNYANIFNSNRIKFEFLPDLDKDYLKDMDITIIGDIMAILKYAKNYQTSPQKQEKVQENSRNKNPQQYKKSREIKRNISQKDLTEKLKNSRKTSIEDLIFENTNNTKLDEIFELTVPVMNDESVNNVENAQIIFADDNNSMETDENYAKIDEVINTDNENLPMIDMDFDEKSDGRMENFNNAGDDQKELPRMDILELPHKELSTLCQICGDVFNTKQSLFQHMKNSHKDVQDIELNNIKYGDQREKPTCQICKKTYTNKYSLYDHTKKFHSNRIKKKFKCPKCPDIFVEKNELLQHLDSAHLLNYKYQCKYCDYKSNSTVSFNQHNANTHDGNSTQEFKCESCEHRFTSESLLKAHVKAKHELNSAFKCMISGCEQSFKNRHGLNNHTNNSHKFQCDQCNFSTRSKDTLTVHISVEHNHIKPFKCDSCDKSFSQKALLSYHIKLVHEKIRDHKCQLCDKLFGTKNELQRHVQGVHEGVRDYKCDSCERGYRQIGALIAHQKAGCDNSIPRPKFKCDSCNFVSINNKEKLSEHILLVHHGIKPYQCETCEKKFTRKDLLKAHLEAKCRNYKKVHQNNFNCDSCDKSFVTESNLKNHMDLTCKNAKINLEEDQYENQEKSNNKKLYKCSICQSEFESLRNLNKHITEIHIGSVENLNKRDLNSIKEANTSYKCYKCDLVYTQMADLTKKFLDHKNSPHPYDCGSCDKKFTLKEFRISHRVQVHRIVIRKKTIQKCETCGKITDSPVALADHISFVHHGIKLYGCEICEKRFSKKDIFRKHMKRQHQEIFYTCLICEQTFGNIMSLGNHMVLHPEHQLKNPYKCAICDFEFDSTEKLTNHMSENHSDRKDGIVLNFNFKCDACDKKFDSKIALSDHVANQHGKINGKIKCDFCDMRFDVKHELSNHMKSQHHTYCCSICKETYSDNLKLKNHISEVHAKKISSTDENNIAEKKFENEIEDMDVDNEYESISNLQLVVHRSQKDHKCKSCGKSFPHSSVLKMHINSFHNKGEKENNSSLDFPPPKYEEVFLNVNQNSETEEENINTKYGGNYGPEKQFEESNFQTNNIPKYGCSDCEYKTNDKTVLINHIKTYHIESLNYHSTKEDTTNKISTATTSLEEKTTNNNSKFDGFKCEYKNCNKSYSARKHLSLHITNIHLKSNNTEIVEQVSDDTVDMDPSQRNLIKTEDEMKIEREIDKVLFEYDFNDDVTNIDSNAKSLQNSSIITENKKLPLNEIPNTTTSKSEEPNDIGLIGNCAKYGCSDCEFKTDDKRELILHIRKSHT